MNNIDKSKFKLVEQGRIHDQKLSTKPISYFADVWYHFTRNKSSVVAGIIIVVLVLFALFQPLVQSWSGTSLTVSWLDADYNFLTPKLKMFEGTAFWSGASKRTTGERDYEYYLALGLAANYYDNGGSLYLEDGINGQYAPIKKFYGAEMVGKAMSYSYLVDGYYGKGFFIKSVSRSDYEMIRAWEEESGLHVIFPMVSDKNNSSNWAGIVGDFNTWGNYWYMMDTQGNAVLSETGELVPNYLLDANGDVAFYQQTGLTGSQYLIRVQAYNYFMYKHGFEPVFTFGTDLGGFDIASRLAGGIKLSLMLSIFVSLLNLLIGAFIGAHAGYYGGWVDMTIERLTDILANIPFMVVVILFKAYLVDTGQVSSFVGLLFAFVATGWIATSGLVRMQFYRFKNMEYIMAARTLGAGNYRLMFKHIFPNAIGTMITSSVLVIPGVIASESMLSYLGIINLGSASVTSIGTMLAAGRSVVMQYPHILLFPAVVLSLLMICFNLVGNGLRDAFNPSLRGAE